jgi:hypothetical protein
LAGSGSLRQPGLVERRSSDYASKQRRKIPEQNVLNPAWHGRRIVTTRLTLVILVVEDEFLLRLDSAETIESEGFEVIQAANADEAIAILKARPDIHVVSSRDRWTG